MGHLAGKDVFRKVGKKIDGLGVRVHWNEALHRIVREIFSEAEADLYVRMPYGLSPLDRLERVTGIEPARLRTMLEAMADKGLVLDIWAKDAYYYMPSPLFVGLFEFTMMRTDAGANPALMARLFHEYLGDGLVYRRNSGGAASVGPLRALPHEGTVQEGVEVLDYEKATALVAAASRFSIGLCSCRHQKEHLGERQCPDPLEMCTSMDKGADFLIRHQMAREISRGEMLDHLARSRERGLVLCADNVRAKVGFICNCCPCCCEVMRGISRFGYPHTVVTSSFIAHSNAAACSGCAKCAKACPIQAITMRPVAAAAEGKKKKQEPVVDTALCMGCGVCALDCSTGAMRLDKRGQRVIHPETTFERVVLQCLDHGTLQNLIFDDPGSVSQDAMRAILGAFLALPPVKKGLMSDVLRSRFLGAMKSAVVARQDKADLLEL